MYSGLWHGYIGSRYQMRASSSASYPFWPSDTHAFGNVAGSYDEERGETLFAALVDFVHDSSITLLRNTMDCHCAPDGKKRKDRFTGDVGP